MYLLKDLQHPPPSPTFSGGWGEDGWGGGGARPAPSHRCLLLLLPMSLAPVQAVSRESGPGLRSGHESSEHSGTFQRWAQLIQRWAQLIHKWALADS